MGRASSLRSMSLRFARLNSVFCSPDQTVHHGIARPRDVVRAGRPPIESHEASGSQASADPVHIRIVKLLAERALRHLIDFRIDARAFQVFLVQ